MGMLAVLVFAIAQEEVPIFCICGPLAFAFLVGFVVAMMLTARDELAPLEQVCAQLQPSHGRPTGLWCMAAPRSTKCAFSAAQDLAVALPRNGS